MDDPDLGAALDVLAGRALLAEVVEAVGHDVPVVALKGVVLSALGERQSPPAAPRFMRDLDVLVEPAARDRVEARLAARGFRVVARTPVATTLRHPDHALDLDLHVALAEHDLFRVEVAGLLARSVPARDLLGVDARRLAPADAYAHLVVHFVRGRSNARDTRHVADFARLARAEPVPPAVQASHLDALGLGRAGRYALGVAAASGDAHAAAVLAALAPDPAGELAASIAARWLARAAGSSPAAVPAVHLLNDRTRRGARSLATHVARGASALARRVLERR